MYIVLRRRRRRRGRVHHPPRFSVSDTKAMCSTYSLVFLSALPTARDKAKERRESR